MAGVFVIRLIFRVPEMAQATSLAITITARVQPEFAIEKMTTKPYWKEKGSFEVTIQGPLEPLSIQSFERLREAIFVEREGWTMVNNEVEDLAAVWNPPSKVVALRFVSLTAVPSSTRPPTRPGP